MRIARVRPHERVEFLAIVNAEIRPGRANTNAWEDFPLILGAANLDWQLIAKDSDGRIAGGIACLIRDFQTSCGVVSVAGIGSVVTRPEFRGQGLSRSLQVEMLELLRRQKIPLGVLWTDKPEIYAGRGFVPAGWEVHVQLPRAGFLGALPGSHSLREFRSQDSPAVAALYELHPLRTLRKEADASLLYNMPGTNGVVAVDEQDLVRAAVFCGKGADFPGYVTEWNGPLELVMGLLQHVRGEGWAQNVLVCAGGEALLEPMGQLGATWFAQASGLWKVICPEELMDCCQEYRGVPPQDITDPRGWLGDVDEAGNPRPGILDLAVWGFDSV